MTALQNAQAHIINILERLSAYVSPDGREVLDGWRFLDWSTNDNEKVKYAGLQGLMAWTFDCGSRLCMFLELADQAAKYAGMAKTLRQLRPDCHGNKVAAAVQTMGKLAGFQKLDKILSADPFCDISTFFGYFILNARAEQGDIAGSVELLRQYWGKMLDFGATTFWEDFDLNWTTNATRIDELPETGRSDIHADFGKYCYTGVRHSLCHGWAGGPTAFMSQYILGVSPVSPGFARVKIRPALNLLSHFEGAVPTPHGAIIVKVKNGHSEIFLPPGVAMDK